MLICVGLDLLAVARSMRTVACSLALSASAQGFVGAQLAKTVTVPRRAYLVHRNATVANASVSWQTPRNKA